MALRRSEPYAGVVGHTSTTLQGTTMADRTGLKLVGFIFATVTLAVMLATGMVVKGYADGAYTFDSAPMAGR
jgi:hypothetical protein